MQFLRSFLLQFLRSFLLLASLVTPAVAQNGPPPLRSTGPISVAPATVSFSAPLPSTFDVTGVKSAALARQPSLAGARAAIAQAQAELKEAGFYPNPTFALEGEEIPKNLDIGAGLVMAFINQSIITSG